MTTGEKIKKVRLEKGLSQREFGKLINKTYTGVSKIERGTQFITVKELLHIKDVLGVSIFDLIHITTEEIINEMDRRKEFINELYGS